MGNVNRSIDRDVGDWLMGLPLTLILVGISIALTYVFPERMFVLGMLVIFFGIWWGLYRYLPIERNIYRFSSSFIVALVFSLLLDAWIVWKKNPDEWNLLILYLMVIATLLLFIVETTDYLKSRGLFK